MSVSALLYLEISLAQRLKANITPVLDQDGNQTGWEADDLSDSERNKLLVVNVDLWKKPDITTPIGTNKYVLFHVCPIPENLVNDVGPELVWIEHFSDVVVEKLNTGLGNPVIPVNDIPYWGGAIGVWGRDGAQWGTTIVPPVYDEQGQEITPEQVTGTPVYPIHNKALDFMPDVDGQPATELTDVNLILGWKPRRWA